MRSLLLVFRHGPHGLGMAREGLDLAFAAVAYEFELSVLFVDDGVTLLMPGQDTAAALQKDFARGFAALPEHGAARVGVDRDSLLRRGLHGGPLLLPARMLDPNAARQWLREADAILSF